MPPGRRRPRCWLPAAIATSVIAISVLHYLACGHWLVFHEIFRRLYYVPIVVAAVMFGTRGGLATSAFSSVLYVPHIWLGVVDGPAQYGELLVFNVVGAVTGLIADRLRAERNRLQQAAQELERMYAGARAQAQERVRLERLATIGRLGSGLAHEIRNPLAGLLGCLEILEADYPDSHPKTEFFQIAKKEVARLGQLATSFLEFAHPAAPVPRPVDLRQVVSNAVQLVRSNLATRRIALSSQLGASPVYVEVDAEQVKRALLDIMLETTSGHCESQVVVTVEPCGPHAIVRLDMSPVVLAPASRLELFEPFSSCGCGNSLRLATARRLVENQGGTVRTEFLDRTLRCVFTFARCELPATESQPRLAVTEGWIDAR